MLWRDVITLVKQTVTIDTDGYETVVETTKDVCADCNSVTRSEFYEAYKNGLKLSLSARIRCCEYSGEKFIDYNSRRYQVERTYSADGEVIELNCSEVIR